MFSGGVVTGPLLIGIFIFSHCGFAGSDHQI